MAAVLLVDLLDAHDALVQLSFGCGHLALLSQQQVLQLQQLVLTLLNHNQQLLLILTRNRNIRLNEAEITALNSISPTVVPETALNIGSSLILV